MKVSAASARERYAVCAARGEGVRGGQCHQHRLLQQRVDGQPDRIGDVGADEGGVDAFVAQVLDQFGGAAFFQRQRNQREPRGTRGLRAARTDGTAPNW